MRHFQVFLGGIVLLTCAATAQQTSPAPGVGNDVSAVEQKIRDLEDRMVMMEGQIRQLKAGGAGSESRSAVAPTAPVSAPAAEAQVTTPPETAIRSGDNIRLGGAGGAASKALNPDISVIGDFISSAGHNRVDPTPSFQMHESELGLQAVVDPYARADFFLSFGEEGVNLE